MDLIPQGADILSQINNFIAESTRLAEALKIAKKDLDEASKNNDSLQIEISQKEQTIVQLMTDRDSLAESNLEMTKSLQEKEMKINKVTEAKELWRAKYQKTFRENNALKFKVKQLTHPNKFIMSKLKNFIQYGEKTLTEISNIQSESFDSILESSQIFDENNLHVCDEGESKSNNNMIEAKEISKQIETNKRVIDGNETNGSTSVKKVKLADFIVESNSSDATDTITEKKSDMADKNEEHNNNTTNEIISSNEAKDKAPAEKLSADKIWNLFGSKGGNDSDSDQFAYVDDKEIDIDMFKKNNNNRSQKQMEISNDMSINNGNDDIGENNESEKETEKQKADIPVYDVDNSTDEDFELVSGYITQNAITSTTKEEDIKEVPKPQVDIEATVDTLAKEIDFPKNKKEKSVAKVKKVQISPIVEEINGKKETNMQNDIILEDARDQTEQMAETTETQEGRDQNESLEAGDIDMIDNTNDSSSKQDELSNNDQKSEDSEKSESNDEKDIANNEKIERTNVSGSEESHNSLKPNTDNQSSSLGEIPVTANDKNKSSDSKHEENTGSLSDKENNQQKSEELDDSTPKKGKMSIQQNENAISEYRVTHKENPNLAENSFNESNVSIVSNKEHGDFVKVRISFFHVNSLEENLKMTENQKHINRRKLTDDAKHEKYCYLRVRNKSCFAKIMKNISRKFSIPLKKLRLFTLNNEIISPLALVEDVFRVTKTRRFIDVVSVEDPDDFIEGKILSSDS